MSIAAVILFGSLARQDNARGSDTDILLVSEEQKPRHVSVGHLSMFFYPWRKLQEDAREGDLFVCHIVREAKALFDPEDRLGQLKSAFKLRNNYSREIAQATDLGWFLVRHGSNINSALLVKRIVWCARTILIARAAENGRPIFAPNALAAFSGSEHARELLAERHSRIADIRIRRQFQSFLATETQSEEFHSIASQGEFISRFVKTGNRVALQTLEQDDRSRSIYR